MKSLSRTTEIDIEKCVENAGNRFDLILLTSARSREIARRDREEMAESHRSPVVTALLEVQSGITGREYLKKVK